MGFLGHHAGKVLIGAIVAVFALRWLTAVRPEVALAAGAGLFALVLLTWFAMRRHDRSLCERCVAHMSIAPSADAERYRNRLHMVHLLSRPASAAVYLIAVVSTNLMTGSLVGRILWAVAQASLAYLVLAHLTHRRLQPWCPECGEGGPGLIEHTPNNPFAPAS